MRAVVMHEPGNVTVEDMPMPSILEPTDAIIKLAATCICGSDLWPYRGAQPVHERRMGHEYVGTVTGVGVEPLHHALAVCGADSVDINAGNSESHGLKCTCLRISRLREQSLPSVKSHSIKCRPDH